MSMRRIQEWYDFFSGNVYVSFSGGKDSTVLLHLVRKFNPKIPAVFVNTGLEYPEIRDFVKKTNNVEWLKPEIPFPEVIERYGFPVVSKKVSRFIRDLQNPTERNKATRNLRITGFNRKGIFCPSQKIPKKWLRLVDAPFKCSEQCCDIMKKNPFKKYAKESNRVGISGVMAEESSMREKQYLLSGCNSFSSKTNKISTPIAFWTTKDIYDYIKRENISYSKIYDMGELRTGCMFCMYGVHLEEKNNNRFTRMRISHPTQYNFCINTLGIGKVLSFMGVNY
jgi:3'-phosphoadenosine 5'-phosphosulfate sulfotransferase (PAPS reductase)/FAD synthetase